MGPLDTADKQSVPRDRAPKKRKCNIHMYNLSMDHFNNWLLVFCKLKSRNVFKFM